jgi:hypothetical protein
MDALKRDANARFRSRGIYRSARDELEYASAVHVYQFEFSAQTHIRLLIVVMA